MNEVIVSRIKKGTAAQIFGQSLHILIQILSVPLFLNYWGAKLYGEWLILFAISAYFTMFDLGFTGVCEREMAILIAGGNRSEALNVFRTTTFVIFFLSVSLLVVIWFVMPQTSINTLFNLSLITNTDAAWIIMFLALHICINFFSLLIYGGLYCEGRYGLGQFQLSLIALFEFICLVGILVLGLGPLYAAVSYATARILGTFIMFCYLRHTTPWLTPGIRGVRIGIMKRLFMPSIAAMAFPLGNVFNIQGIRIVVGMILGPVAVTTLTTLRTLTRIALILLRSVNTIIQPEMGYAYGLRDMNLMRKLHRRSFQVNLWGSLIVILGLIVFGDLFLIHWTDGKVKMDFTLFALFTAASAINVLWASSLMVSFATNRHTQIAKAFFLINLSGLILAYVFGPKFGLSGVGVIILCIELFMVSFVIQRSIEMTEDSWFKFIAIVKRPPEFLLDVIKEKKYYND